MAHFLLALVLFLKTSQLSVSIHSCKVVPHSKHLRLKKNKDDLHSEIIRKRTIVWVACVSRQKSGSATWLTVLTRLDSVLREFFLFFTSFRESQRCLSDEESDAGNFQFLVVVILVKSMLLFPK